MIRVSILTLAVAGVLGSSHATHAEPTPYGAAVHLSGKIGPRAAASRGETGAQSWVASQFAAAGLAVTTDKFPVRGKGTSRNVVGELDGPASCLQILVAHVDSGPRGPGANDNSSGVGMLVSLAHELKNLNPPCDVWLASTGAEERGFTHAADHLGAAALVARVKRLDRAGDLRFAYDNDEVGRLGRFWLRSPAAQPRAGVEGAILAAARRAGVTVRWVRDEGTATPTSGNSTSRAWGRRSSRAGTPTSRAASAPATSPDASRRARSTARCKSRRRS